MARSRFEVPAGVVDGVNAVFTTAFPYVANSSAVFLNGQLKKMTLLDGWVETAPTSGVVTLKVPPTPLDVVQVFYWDASGGEAGPVLPFVGGLVEVGRLTGTLFDQDVPRGDVQERNGLRGGLRSVE